MNADDLLQVLHRKEFQPVELHLSDGRTLPVPHPDYFLLFPNRQSALVFPDGVHFEMVDVQSIVRAVPARSQAA